jgi:pyruvyl transferase EpsI
LGKGVLEIPAVELLNREKAFAAIIPKNKVIYIPGGGFLGNLWVEEEYEFRRIVSAFSKHKIVVFPQTITFDMESEDGRTFFEDSHAIYSSHKNITIFVRDKRSYEFMKEYMPDVKCMMVPDIVTQLDVKCVSTKRDDILLCLRNDVEKLLSNELVNSILYCIKSLYPMETVKMTDTVVDQDVFLNERTHILQQKYDEFSSAKLVITDRLHGMLFAAITGTPCICFNNKNGKVGAQYEWIKNNEYIVLVNNMEQFIEAINHLDLDKRYHYDNNFAKESITPLIECIKYFN